MINFQKYNKAKFSYKFDCLIIVRIEIFLFNARSR